MSTYKVVLELHIEADSLDGLDDLVYDAVADAMRTDIMSACEVEEIK